MYQPSGNYDVLLGLGIPSSVSEALDQFLQEGFVEELSASIIESFTKLNEGDAMKCVQMMRDQCKDNNLSVGIESLSMKIKTRVALRNLHFRINLSCLFLSSFGFSFPLNVSLRKLKKLYHIIFTYFSTEN